MPFPRETVERVARLARLELSEEEIERFTHDLDGILKAFEVLQEESIPETGGSIPDALPIKVRAMLREDVTEQWPDSHLLLEGAAMKRGLMRGPRSR